ncbi:MAG: OsmC family protein [Thermodesulfobacteriota bacterium]|nr:OsmC family protein [Thermodesulfobacteriota bacterium]
MKEILVKYVRNLQQEAKIGHHSVIIDEPKEFGGDDKGPDPYDLLLAALGGCTALTLLSYARRKGIPLEGLQIKLNHDKIYANDCEECSTVEGKLDQITKTIYFQGPLSDEQKENLLEIAKRCPVHRTLTSENRILDTLGV